MLSRASNQSPVVLRKRDYALTAIKLREPAVHKLYKTNTISSRDNTHSGRDIATSIEIHAWFVVTCILAYGNHCVVS
jgi:hypothetical protein